MRRTTARVRAGHCAVPGCSPATTSEVPDHDYDYDHDHTMTSVRIERVERVQDGSNGREHSVWSIFTHAYI